MPERPYRILIWAAVSSAPQAASDKTSLSDQEQAGREFAAAVSGDVLEVLHVPGHSRDIVLFEDAARQMDAYRRLYEHCQKADFDVLWALDPDRLGRDPALAQTVSSLVERAGAELFCASAPHALGQASIGQRYVYAIQSVRAGEDQRVRVARHERGMRGRVRRGLHPGTWPYGYRAVRDARGTTTGAEVVPEEAAVLRIIAARFLAGVSYRDIARELNDRGFRTSSTAQRWYGTRVRKIVFNDAYAGFPSWRQARPEDASARYPHLWDASMHAAIVAERRRRGARPHHTTAMLDVAFCNRCGGRMTANRVVNSRGCQYAYLRCGAHANGDARCHPNHILEADVQDAIVAYLADALSDPDSLRQVADARGPPTGLEEELAQLDERAEDIAARRQRIALALAAGTMDAQMYRQTDDELLDELDGVNAARAEIEAQLEAIPSWEQQVATMTSLLEALDSLWEMPPRKAASLLQRVGVRVFVEEGKVVSLGLF